MRSFDSIIPQLARKPELHARFVNTVSLLEYMGARKILKSQQAGSLTIAVLAHAAEEIRHAQVFKKIALKMSRDLLETYSEEHLLCGERARAYMQSIDRGIEAEIARGVFSGSGPVSPERLNYLLTTLLVEERVVRVYPGYDVILTECGFPAALQGILREEGAHLESIRSELEACGFDRDGGLGRLRELEERVFGEWMEACGRAAHIAQ